MAVSKVQESASFSIEVRKGTDALGNPTYSKKSFSNVNVFFNKLLERDNKK